MVQAISSEISRHNFESFDFNHLESKLERCGTDRPRLIHIGGVSAVGKTTMSLILNERLDDSLRFSADSYLVEGLRYKYGQFDDISPDPNKPYIGGISPDIWDMDLLEIDIQKLLQGQNINLPIFDQTIKDRIGYRNFKPSKNIIFEGGQSFSESLRKYADYKILLTAPFHDRLIRKIVRTHARYKRDDIDDVVGRYLTKDEPSWVHYQKEFTEISDQVFFNPAMPCSDYSNLPLARYNRASNGKIHNLTPTDTNGHLYDGEEFGFIELPDSTHQLFYSVDGKQLVNLPLKKEYIKLLTNYYELS